MKSEKQSSKKQSSESKSRTDPRRTTGRDGQSQTTRQLTPTAHWEIVALAGDGVGKRIGQVISLGGDAIKAGGLTWAANTEYGFFDAGVDVHAALTHATELRLVRAYEVGSNSGTLAGLGERALTALTSGARLQFAYSAPELDGWKPARPNFDGFQYYFRDENADESARGHLIFKLNIEGNLVQLVWASAAGSVSYIATTTLKKASGEIPSGQTMKYFVVKHVSAPPARRPR